MARGKGKKGKKGKKKEKIRLRKFNLDLFGIFKFTRFHGAPWEAFMYAGDKRKKGGKKSNQRKKKQNKKEKVNIPKLPMFPPVTWRPKPKKRAEIEANKRELRKQFDADADRKFPTTQVGERIEKTTRSEKPLFGGGSVRDVLCGPKFPLPPRPLPHGGVYGDPKCPMCSAAGGLIKTIFGMLHKKMKKLVTNEYDKAKFILEFLISKLNEISEYYRNHFKRIIEEFEPILDKLDEDEWDDHFKVKDLIQKWKELIKEYDDLKNELRKYRKNREDEILRGIEDELRTLEALEKRLADLEKQLAHILLTLEEWKNPEERLKRYQDELARLLIELQRINESVLAERDYLRKLLDWESKNAMKVYGLRIEEIVHKDVDTFLDLVNSAWFRLSVENEHLTEELTSLDSENHLMMLEVQNLTRQIEQLKEGKGNRNRGRLDRFRPPSSANELMKALYETDKRTYNMIDELQTNYIHEFKRN